MADASGNLVETDRYDSFGNSAGSGRTRYGYTGRERDHDTGLMYYRARWYDPQVGRFISEDPIGFRGGELDLYVYVRNNATRFHDPLGLRRCNPILGAIVGGVGGGVIGALGGGGLGALGGAGIGCIAGGLGLGTLGTLVEPGGGTVAGGLSGCAAGAALLAGPGAAAGAIVGSGVGVGVGIGVGINYCNGDDTCDEPRVLPFPKVEPIPVPPPTDLDDCIQRLVRCLRFAGTDPRRSEECRKAFEACKEQLK
jgi:RHS repeat-associated protein